MTNPALKLTAFALCCTPLLTAQRGDTTVLKQAIIFARHGVRTPVLPNATLNQFAVQPYPAFPLAGISVLTPNGGTNETLLGGYFRLWLTHEGLLTSNDTADSAFVYLRAEDQPLITDTAHAFATGMLPAASVKVNTVPGSDPLFDPVGAGVAQLDQRMAVAAVKGRLGANPQSLSSAYAPEFALLRSVLLNYPLGQTPLPATPAGVLDVTAGAIEIGAGTASTPVTIGSLANVVYAIDPFVMEYADGMPAEDVGWGKLNATGVSQITRLYNLALDLEFRTPYLAKLLSSNVASHIVRSMVQTATGNAMTGALGSPSTKLVVLVAGNTNLTGFGGLLNLDWVLPGYPVDTFAPGGALVFELRQSQRSGEYVVRTTYVTQTMDQLRNRTPLTLTTPPAIAPVFIPNCSVSNATYDCPLATFVKLAHRAIDAESVDLVN